MATQHVQRAVGDALSRKFIHTEEMSRVLSLALSSEKNAIIYGPAGHGKSQMVETVVDALGLDAFTQFFGEGMDEARLFGGLNFERFNKEHVLEYQTDRSFLVHEYAVFEEVFDAPASVLLALKDTLTSGWLRNGPQQVKSRCKTIIALTNRAPKDISELGPAAHALIERFPLQLNLEWPEYTSDNYLDMFNRVAGSHPINSSLAAVIADEDAGFVSPRTAMHALHVVKTAASLRGSSKVEECDMNALQFVPGLETLAKKLRGKLDAVSAKVQVDIVLKEVSSKHDELQRRDTDSPIKALKVAKEMFALASKLSGLRVPDDKCSLVDKKKTQLMQAFESLQKKALELTRID